MPAHWDSNGRIAEVTEASFVCFGEMGAVSIVLLLVYNKNSRNILKVLFVNDFYSHVSANSKWHLSYLVRRYISKNDYCGEDEWFFSISLTCSEFIEIQQNVPIHTITFYRIFFLKISFKSSKTTAIHVFNVLLSVTHKFLLFFNINFY